MLRNLMTGLAKSFSLIRITTRRVIQMTFVKKQTAGPLRSVRNWGVPSLILALAAAYCVLLPVHAMANKVHCETKVFHNNIRVKHDNKTSSDANRNYVICESSKSHGATHKGYAYAKEGWLSTGNQYILDNWVYTNCTHYSCSAHAHHHSTSPSTQGKPDKPAPPVDPPGTLTNIVFTHVNYRDVGPGQISIELVPDTFVQIWLGDPGHGESVISSLTLTVDGVASKVELMGQVGTGGASVTSNRTGLFNGLEFRITPYPNLVYVLQFTSLLRFNVVGSLMSDLALDAYKGNARLKGGSGSRE